MNENEIRQALKKQEINLNFSRLSEFEDFERILTDETRWYEAKWFLLYKNTSKYCPKNDGIGDDSVWDENYEGLCVHFETEYSPALAIVNPSTAPLSLNERANMKCKYIVDIMKDDISRYASLISDAVQFYREKNGKNIRIITRAGVAIAFHASVYNTLSQEVIFQKAIEYMQDRFKSSHFEGATFNHDKTEMLYSICNGKDSFLEKYAEDWINSGQPASLLEKTYPTLSFSTSDTGRYPLRIRPILKIGKGQYPLGGDLEIKHNSLADLSQFNEYANMAYSKLENGIENARAMIAREIKHPAACFVKVASKVGLTKKAKALMQGALVDFKDEFEGQKVNAFNIYTTMCELTLRKEFEELSEQNRLNISECIARVATLNWDEVDKSGVEEI